MNAGVDMPATRTRYPGALIDRITLADGRMVVVRPVLSLDAPAEQDFVRALSRDSRHKRFHAALVELPPTLLRQMTDVDHEMHVAIVAEALDADGESTGIVADARYVRDAGAAEFAIAVADAWQGVGLGRALMQRLLRYAARHGVTTLVADMLVGNTAMTCLATSFGGRLTTSPHGPGVMRACFDLARGAGTAAKAFASRALHATRSTAMGVTPART